MADPFKITKIRQSVWDRLHEFRAFMDGGKVRQYRTKWATSLSDSVAVLLDIQKELEKMGWTFERVRGKWGYGWTGEVKLIPPEIQGKDEPTCRTCVEFVVCNTKEGGSPISVCDRHTPVDHPLPSVDDDVDEPNQDLMDLMKDTEQVQDEIENDS